MALTQIQKLKLNQQIDMILQSPANQVRDGKLEMAFVFDLGSDPSYLRETAAQVAGALKQHDRIFQNVRCNAVYWAADGLSTEVLPMSYVQLGRVCGEAGDKTEDGSEKTCPENQVIEKNRRLCPENQTVEESTKPRLEDLTGYLKLYHARSKCILVITEGNYKVSDRKSAREALNPFLKSRLVMITPQELQTGLKLFMDLL